MTQRCVTLAEFLLQAPEFLTFGSESDGTLTVASQPDAGDTITLATRYGVPIVTETYVADTDFDIGGDETATATNIAAALDGGELAAASSDGAVVSILTATGPVGALALTSDTVDLVWNETPMTPGEEQVMFALNCACSQINLGCWGVKADCAHVYLTAHFLELQGRTGSGAANTSKTIDKLAIGFAIGVISSELVQTKWGRMYSQLRESVLVLPVIGRGLVC